MSIKDSVRKFFGLDDEHDDYVESTEMTQVDQQKSQVFQKNNAKVIPLDKRSTSQKTNIQVLEPRVYSEAEKLAEHLLKNEPIILNFRRMEAKHAEKVIDFLQGAVYAINGDMQQVGEAIFLCTPPNVSITNAGLEEQRDEYYY